MVKRILNPQEFEQVVDEIFALFEHENKDQGHHFLKHDQESIKRNFSHPSILAWDLFVWAHFTNNKVDAIIAFFNDKNVKFGTKIFSEYIWLSKNPKAGYKLFSVASKFAKQNDFKYLIMNTVVKHPSHEKVKLFYKKMGLIKDSETYICKL